MGYSEQEKLDIVRIYYRFNNLKLARNQYLREYPERVTPCKATIHYIIKKFQQRKTVFRKKRTVARKEEQDLEVLLYFQGKYISI